MSKCKISKCVDNSSEDTLCKFIVVSHTWWWGVLEDTAFTWDILLLTFKLGVSEFANISTAFSHQQEYRWHTLYNMLYKFVLK